MSNVSPGWKLRVLLAQALFSNPDILLLDEPTNNLDIDTIRWLEDVLNERNSTMIIISHDRHFLNQVCTHVADMDYGTLKIYPGNYDEYMFASTQARNQQLANNAKAKDKVAELQDFVRRFAANKSKARQATSRAKQIEKIKVDDIKPSSRAYPFVRFDGEKKLHRLAVEVENISKSFDKPLFKNFSIMVEAGERIAIIGANGVGKTTMLRCIASDLSGLQPDQGRVKWAENANVGYMPQDPTEDFAKDDNLTDWIGKWTQEGDDDQAVRSILGRLLFGGDEVKKSVRVLSGGEKGRMMYGKLMLGRHNVLMLDEPTNHMDMESIESLNIALEKYAGTLVFVSHDREFVSSLANRVIEIKENEVIDFRGNYEDYLKSQGID
jgi:ATPase subunit of ABC transporter with duplicated ATPase domains